MIFTIYKLDVRMIVDEVTYDTDAQHLSIKLKPIFQAFKIISDNSNNCSQKVTTLRKVSCKTLSEYLAENIELSLKNKVTTLESVANIKKEPHNETQILNGTPDGTLHELFNKILQPVLYKADTILLYERVKMYLEGLKIEKNSL
mgnify:CR=1 FL=1